MCGIRSRLAVVGDGGMMWPPDSAELTAFNEENGRP